jgi:predicted dehydrogenase
MGPKGNLNDERVAVFGTGSIGMRHLKLLKSIEGIVPLAVPARPDRVAALRAQGFEAAAIDEVAKSDLLAAVIATDTGRHVEDALRVASRPLLVEKPIAASVANAAALEPLASRIHVACVLRFDEGLAWVKARLAAIAPIVAADVECLSWLPSWRPSADYKRGYAARPGEGGVLLDLIHEVDYCQWLFGAAKRVAARLENKGVLGLPGEVDESAALTVEHESGIVVSMRLSYAVRPTSRRVVMHGANGRLEYDLVSRRARHVDAEGREAETFTSPAIDTMYRAQAEAWLQHVRSGKRDERLTGYAEALRDVAVCDAARRASQSGAWQEVSTR